MSDLFTPPQTHGFHCADCGELWDAYQTPCPMEVAIRAMDTNKTCITCQSAKVLVVQPWRYQQLKRERVKA